MKSLISFMILALCTRVTFSQTVNSKPFILGSTEEIHSTILEENRILNIYLPDGYTPSDTVRYPVIYLLDGGTDEDFIHVVGLVQFNSFEWVNRIPKSIVVGIANTDRKRDFTYPTSIDADKKRYPTAGHSDRFIAFIEQELQPFIAKKYKVSPTKTIIGESLGGLLAAEILLKHKALFDKYIIISPSIWWDNGSLLSQSFSANSGAITSPTDVYIGVGKEGLTPGDNPRVMEVDANLFAEKIKNEENKNITVYFDYLPQEDHATIAHQAIYNAFRIFSSSTSGKK